LLDAVLDALADEPRAVFVLFEWEGLSMQEIASLMEVPVQTAYARLYAARKHVQAGLSGIQTDGAPR
jgi:RNA polymerase sigma-70 factor (ECF subfamily)